MRKTIFLLLLSGLLCVSITEIKGQENSLIKRTIKQGEQERVYLIHYPGNLKPEIPSVLLVVLHGANGTPDRMAERTEFNKISDREGFTVVYPGSIGKQWNDGRGVSTRRGKDVSTIDDVGFISSLIDSLIITGDADSSNIFVTGMSNGGMMTYRLGIEIGSKIKAIAAVIANIPVSISEEKPAKKLPVLIMNGTEDPIIPWNGGKVKILWKNYGEVVSTEKTLNYWLSADSITSKPLVTILPDKDKEDNCRVEKAVYKAGNKPEQVVLFSIKGGGHNLPGGNTPDRPRVVGHKCNDITATEEIWLFFKQYVKN